MVLSIAGAVPFAACAASRPARGHSSHGLHQGSAPSRSRVLLGRSVRHRRILAVELRSAHARRAVLVVGCIHGDEPAVDLWVLDDLNPDGVAAGTRQNAHGVDVNRNFPWRWRPIGRAGDQQYPGPRSLSEPEARVAHALVLRLRPSIAIWFHQPLAVVDESGGSVVVERRFARLARLPLRRLPRYPGSAAGWQDHRVRGTTAFVVELPPGRPTAAALSRYSTAVRRLAAESARG